MIMRIQRIVTLLLIIAVLFSFGASASAKDFKITIASGHPPVFLWVSMARDYFIPEVDKRLEGTGHKIIWNQAWGGTVAKIGGVLEATEEGIVEIGFVSTLFEAPKMPLHNISYMTPFGTDDVFIIANTIANLQAKIPALQNEWTSHNLVYLGGAALDTYGLMTNFPVNSVDDIKGHKIAAPGPAANWIKGTGAVAVAGNLNTFYNDIKTGVYEGTLTFMTAAAASKLHEVAPKICMVNFGAQYAGGVAINKDIYDAMPPEVQKVLKEVGLDYTAKFAQAQTSLAAGAVKMMEKNGATVVHLSQAERKRWAAMLPNVPMGWATAMEKKGLPGKQMLQGFLDELRAAGVELARDWDK